MSHSVKTQPFDLRVGDEVTVVTPGDESLVPGRVTMAAAPIYEVRLDSEFSLEVGTPIRCEPAHCHRKSRILASVVGHKKGETRIWITAMEIKVGVERAKRIPTKGWKAEVTPELGTVELRDISNSGLSFTCNTRVFPGDPLTVEVSTGVMPVKVKAEVVHVTQDVGTAEVVVGCRLTEKSEAWADMVRRAQTVPMAKAS